MSLRKQRIPFQGLSNKLAIIKNSQYLNQKEYQKTKTQSKVTKKHNISQLLTQSLNFNVSKYDVPNLNASSSNYTQFHSLNKKQIQPNREISKNNDSSSKYLQGKRKLNCKDFKMDQFQKEEKLKQMNELNPKIVKMLQKIRCQYKYNANVRKIIKGWGFQDQGCISNDKFHQIVLKHFDSTVSKQDCQQLMNQFSNKNTNIDLLGFIKLVFNSQPFTKPHIQVFDSQSTKNKTSSQISPQQTLIKKIHDLNQGNLCKIIQKNNKLSEVLPQIKPSFSVTYPPMNVSQLEKTFNFDKTQPSIYQTLHSASSPKLQYFNSKAHIKQFTPTLYQGKNQQKTRFNATPILELNDQRLMENKREKIIDEKYKILKQLDDTRKKQKLRYQNKLQRIRMHRQKENQTINEIDKNEQMRDGANMRRFREQNVAYNYVNFIHNDWR